MAFHLFCYSTVPKDEIALKLKQLVAENQSVFSSKFLISDVTQTHEVGKSIAAEYGFKAQSTFLIRLNDKSVANEFREAVDAINSKIGSDNLLVLRENEELVK